MKNKPIINTFLTLFNNQPSVSEAQCLNPWNSSLWFPRWSDEEAATLPQSQALSVSGVTCVKWTGLMPGETTAGVLPDDGRSIPESLASTTAANKTG